MHASGDGEGREGRCRQEDGREAPHESASQRGGAREERSRAMEARGCPLSARRHARDRGLSPLRIPAGTNGCRAVVRLASAKSAACTRSPRFWPRNRVLARDGTTARDTENAEQAFCRRKRRTDNAKEGLKESFRARTEARQEVGPPEAVRGRPGGPGGAAGRGPHARGGGEGAPRRGESKNPAAPPSGVWWPKTTDSRAQRRGACCALAVQTRKAATTRQPRPSRKCRQIPISVSARRAQPRQSREGPPPRSARRR